MIKFIVKVEEDFLRKNSDFDTIAEMVGEKPKNVMALIADSLTMKAVLGENQSKFIITADSIQDDSANFFRLTVGDLCALSTVMKKDSADAPSDYVGRMEEELDELCERKEKLDAFMQTETFRSLPERKRELMARQHDIMNDYIGVLHDRLALENPDEEPVKEELSDAGRPECDNG